MSFQGFSNGVYELADLVSSDHEVCRLLFGIRSQSQQAMWQGRANGLSHIEDNEK